ncbi:MAG: 1-acyl-sn-glycerol-3-phosphate acyltransferase [Deltaproteobacteria bacterium]|nr:MAG: 1-acyl-sn-glycerol-3-phosphate acyltransferase [Deltaproteobacteria bacterium]
MIYVFRALFAIFCTGVCAALAIPAALVDGRGDSMVWIARRWARWILAACGVRVRATGLENVTASAPQVFMSNHQSLFDIVALVATLPVSFRFIAKKELTRVPVFGWALVLTGHVIVDRGDRRDAFASLERAAERIRSGTNVIIFPEGTRSETGELLPLKSGGFQLALDSKVPIVPVTVSGSRSITPKNSLRIESGVIGVAYGRPIPTAGLRDSDRNDLKRRVRSAIQQGFDPLLQAPRGSGEPADARLRRRSGVA